MAQFDVFRNSSNVSKKHFPYLLDIQNNLHSRLLSRMVVPLAVGVEPIKHLTPVFTIEGQNVVMYTMDMTSVLEDVLSELVINIEDKRTEILDAIDFLVNGF